METNKQLDYIDVLINEIAKQVEDIENGEMPPLSNPEIVSKILDILNK